MRVPACSSPDAVRSAAGQQLADPRSFASRLAPILQVRKQHGLSTGTLRDVPEVPVPQMLILVNRLYIGAAQITVLNFGPEPGRGTRPSR